MFGVSNSLTFGMFGVSNSIANDILQKHLQDSSSLFVDQTRNPLHSTSSSKTSYSRLRDALDVVTQHLPMPLCTSLTQTFATLTTASHGVSFKKCIQAVR